jgi:hypothetical protein
MSRSKNKKGCRDSHSLFEHRLSEETKKAMGDREAAHGLFSEIKLFTRALGRPPPLFSPSTTNYFSSM